MESNELLVLGFGKARYVPVQRVFKKRRSKKDAKIRSKQSPQKSMTDQPMLTYNKLARLGALYKIQHCPNVCWQILLCVSLAGAWLGCAMKKYI